MDTKYRVEIWHDPDTERPDEYGPFRFVSFSNRHTNYEHPETYTMRECSTCEGTGEGGYDDDGWCLGCKQCEGVGEVECHPADHPDVLATLSYYEHGLCRWMVGESSVPDHGGFDTVNVAGVIVKSENWDSDGYGYGEWWDGMTSDEQRNALDLSAEIYTQWCNGETYGYTIERAETCRQCGHTQWGLMGDASCGGFIGADYMAEEIGGALAWIDDGVNPDDVEYVGDGADTFAFYEKGVRKGYDDATEYRWKREREATA